VVFRSFILCNPMVFTEQAMEEESGFRERRRIGFQTED
jgi:hypothetical protein